MRITTTDIARPRSIIVVVADNFVRWGVDWILIESGFDVADHAGDYASALAQIEKMRPDVALVGLEPRPEAISFIQAIKRVSPDVAVVMLGDPSTDFETVVEGLKAGASTYLPRFDSIDLFLNELLLTMREPNRMHPDVVTELLQYMLARKQERSPLASLTPREEQVLAHLFQGTSNREIARKMYVSERTVKAHVSNILKKLNVAGRVQAVIKAHELGWKPSE